MPQRGCRRVKRCAFSGVSVQAGLVAGDRLVLGAVVLEHAAQVAQAREQREVAEEDRGAQDPLDEPEQERRAELVLDQAREPDGHDEEQADRERERDDDRAGPHAARDLLLVLGQLRVGGDAERLEADAPATRRARRRRARSAGAAARCFLSTEVSGNDWTSISPSAASSGRAPSSAICSGSGLRTATAQVETPRIITPSRTAWPPTGASRCATERARPAGAVAVSRRWLAAG